MTTLTTSTTSASAMPMAEPQQAARTAGMTMALFAAVGVARATPSVLLAEQPFRAAETTLVWVRTGETACMGRQPMAAHAGAGLRQPPPHHAGPRARARPGRIAQVRMPLVGARCSGGMSVRMELVLSMGVRLPLGPAR